MEGACSGLAFLGAGVGSGEKDQGGLKSPGRGEGEKGVFCRGRAASKVAWPSFLVAMAGIAHRQAGAAQELVAPLPGQARLDPALVGAATADPDPLADPGAIAQGSCGRRGRAALDALHQPVTRALAGRGREPEGRQQPGEEGGAVRREEGVRRRTVHRGHRGALARPARPVSCIGAGASTLSSSSSWTGIEHRARATTALEHLRLVGGHRLR